MIRRFTENPLITPADLAPSRPGLEVLGVFNPGATMFRGERLLLLRVAERAVPEPGCIAAPVFDVENSELKILQFRLDDPELDASDPRVFSYRGETYLTSISHLRVARSADGVNFKIDPQPSLLPETPYESYGIEDARITCLEGVYYINYTAVSSCGVVTMLASTEDFRSFRRHGIIFAPDNKDIAIFPQKIGDRYVAFHRPSVMHVGRPSVWLASSPNLHDWGQHELVITPRPGCWDSERVGGNSAPILTSEGWLAFYHGSDYNVRYCLGVLLLDRQDPSRVLARSREPFFEPTAPYEREGFMPNVVFHNGTIDPGNGELELYYGAADFLTCGARIDIADLFKHLDWNR